MLLSGASVSDSDALDSRKSFSVQCIPRVFASSIPDEMLLLDQATEMVLQSVAAGSGGTNHVGHRDAFVLADVVDDLEIQLKQGGDHYLLALCLGRQPALLLLQGPQKNIRRLR